MHEYSVVQALLEKVETIALENQASLVTKIIVKIGIMSGIEPHLLEVAFNTFKEKTICDQAQFVLNIQPLIILCQECNQSSELEKAHYCCPQCQSLNIKVMDGEEMLLMSLEMQ